MKRLCPIDLGCFFGRPTVCLPETKQVWSASDVQLINQSSGLSRITWQCSFISNFTLGSLERESCLISRNIHSTNSMKLHWKERQSVMKELNSELTCFWSHEQEVVAVSGYTGSRPLIGSKVIRDRDGFIWSEKGSKVQIQIRRKPSPVRGRPFTQWSEKAPLQLTTPGTHTLSACPNRKPRCSFPCETWAGLHDCNGWTYPTSEYPLTYGDFTQI